MNNARTSFYRYDNDMYANNTIQIGKVKGEEEDSIKNFGRFNNNYSTR